MPASGYRESRGKSTVIKDECKMARKEIKTDLWVASQLDECKIPFDAQGSSVKEIDEALKVRQSVEQAMLGIPSTLQS